MPSFNTVSFNTPNLPSFIDTIYLDIIISYVGQ